jgi:hypothetical protein
VKRSLLEENKTSIINNNEHQHFTIDQIPVRVLETKYTIEEEGIKMDIIDYEKEEHGHHVLH